LLTLSFLSYVNKCGKRRVLIYYLMREKYGKFIIYVYTYFNAFYQNICIKMLGLLFGNSYIINIYMP